MSENTNVNVDNENSNWKKLNTLITQIWEGIRRTSNSVSNKMWGNFTRFFLSIWTSYVLVYNYIAPLFQKTFLIASWSNIIILYVLVFIIGLAIFHLYNILVKIWLYIFS